MGILLVNGSGDPARWNAGNRLPPCAGRVVHPAEEEGTPLTDAGRAAGAGVGVFRGCRLRPCRRASDSPRCRPPPGRGAGRAPAAWSVARRDPQRRLANRTRGGPGLGLRPVSRLVASDRWSGIRTRDTWINRPLLYPSELSRGQRAGLEPATDSIRSCCSPFEPTLSQSPRTGIGIRHGNAARTGRDAKPVPLSPIKIRLRIAACFQAAIGLRRIASRPAPRHPGAAPNAGVTPHRRVFRSPCHGPMGPDASGSRDARLFRTSFANAETKMPPAWSPRAFAVPRKIGVTDLPWKESIRVGLPRLRTQTARTGPHRALAAMASGGRRCGSVSTWSKCGSTQRNGPRESARVRTLLALESVCKRNFFITTDGPVSRPGGIPEGARRRTSRAPTA